MAKSKSTGFKKQTFSSSQMLIIATIFAVVGGIVSWAAFAAPHNGGGGTGTISLAMVTDKNSDGMPNYGDVITFKVSTTATTQPWVTVKCNQNGTLVYENNHNMTFYPNFTLGQTTQWQNGGAADCTATLQNWDNYSKKGNVTDITSMTFHVNA